MTNSNPNQTVAVEVYFYRDYETHFVKTYGQEVGTKLYRDITCPLGDEESRVTVQSLLYEQDHVRVCVLEYDGESTNPLEIAEWCFAKMNHYQTNPLSGDYWLIQNGANLNDISEYETHMARSHNYAMTKRVGTGHTSMSVGDAVRINDKFYLVANIGFEEVKE